MDHNTVETLCLMEKYLLGELSQDQRSQLEEHLFDCEICSARVRSDFAVIENLKQVIREDNAAAVKPAAKRGSWRDWMPLSSLVPLAAAVVFACLTGYEIALNHSFRAARILPAAAVLMPVVRGDISNRVTVDPRNPIFQLEVKGDSTRRDAFTCDFQTASGVRILTLKSPPQPATEFDLRFELPAAGFRPGAYQLFLRPSSEPDRIIAYSFVVEESK